MKWAIAIFAGIFCLSVISNCGRSNGQERNNYNVTIQQTTINDAASGLNLVAVGELVKEVKDAATLERQLNDPAEKINNLDLNEDDKVDYIQVTEYGTDNLRGFSLTTELAEGEAQEIATIEIEKSADGYANVQTHGNQQIYGNNHYYHSRVSLTDMLIVGWLFNSNRGGYYGSASRYNNYPSSYSPYSTRSRSNYDRDVSTRVSSSTLKKSQKSTLSSTVSSPNSNQTATNVKAPLRKPTTTQKSFQARNPSKTVASGGFGKTSRSISPSRPSVRTTSGSSSRSGSFSGGK
ncbi:MAG: hypothetical protein ACI8Z5_001541 [Lentimonas sp.]|jgi:hypothetical protein